MKKPQPWARWTADEDEYLRQNYPDRPTAELAAALGRTSRAVYDRAVDKFRLRKSPAFISALKAEVRQAIDKMISECRSEEK